jgi:IclR family pca regulon transcriptional regulator
MGRVLMAGLPDEVLAQLLARADVPALTSKTCTDPCLSCARKSPGCGRTATPPRSISWTTASPRWPCRSAIRQGRTVAALNTSGYTGVVTPESLVADRLPALREAAAHIGHELVRYPVLQSVLGG